MHREAALVLVLFALKISQFASGLRDPGACEGLVRALGPDARSLRPYLQRHLAVPGVAMREDLFECLLDELPSWPSKQLSADLGRVAQLAQRTADGPAQAQMVRLLWAAPFQRLPGELAERARAAARGLLGRASLPEPVVRRYEALFEDGRRSAEVRTVARLLTEHAFDCRRAPPGDAQLDRLPLAAARHALAILSYFARARSCASAVAPLPGWPSKGLPAQETVTGQIVWQMQASSLVDHGYPKSLGLQESEAADYSRARTIEKERAYNDMLRFVRESMRNASLSSLSQELVLKVGIDIASSCQPPGSTVSLLRNIIAQLLRSRGTSPENKRAFTYLLTSFQHKRNCTRVSIRDLINAHDYLVPQLLEDFQKSVLFESPSVRAYLVTELSVYAKMAHQIPSERRVALLGVATALLTISWPPGRVLDQLVDSASLLQFGSISKRMALKMIPAFLRIHTRPYYEWLSPKRKSYLYLTLLRLIEQLDRMDDSILVAVETVVASPCEKLNLVSVLFRMLQTPTVSSKAFSYIECLILHLLKIPRSFKIDWSVILVPPAKFGPCHPHEWVSTISTTPALSTVTPTATPYIEQTTPSQTAYTETPTAAARIKISTTTQQISEEPTATPSIFTTPGETPGSTAWQSESTAITTKTMAPTAEISTSETRTASSVEVTSTTTSGTSTVTPTATPSIEITTTTTTTEQTPSATASTGGTDTSTVPSFPEMTTTPVYTQTPSVTTLSSHTTTETFTETPTMTPSLASMTTSTETPTLSYSTETTTSTETPAMSHSTQTTTSTETPAMSHSTQTTTSTTYTTTSTATETPSIGQSTMQFSTVTPSETVTYTETPTASPSIETTMPSQNIITPVIELSSSGTTTSIETQTSPGTITETPTATPGTTISTTSEAQITETLTVFPITYTPEEKHATETPTASQSTATTTSTRPTTTWTTTSTLTPSESFSTETTTSAVYTTTPIETTPGISISSTETATESVSTSQYTETPTVSASVSYTTSESSTRVTYPQQTTIPTLPSETAPNETSKENVTSTPMGFRSTIVTSENILSMGTTMVTLPAPTPKISIFTVPSFPVEGATVKFNIEKISHHITHTNESTSNILSIIESIFNMSHPTDITNIIEGAHNITIGHPDIEPAVDEKLIQIIVEALTAEQIRGIVTDRTENLVLELYRIIKSGVRIRLDVLQRILTLKMTAKLRQNIIAILVNRTYQGPAEEVHRVLEILLPYLAVHHISTLTTKEFVHLLVQYLQTTNVASIDGDLRHFMIEILEELTKNPRVPQKQKRRLSEVLEMLLRNIPAPHTKFNEIIRYLRNPKAPIPLTLLISIKTNPRGTAPGSPETIQTLASVLRQSQGNPVVVGNVVSVVLRLLSTNNVPRLQIGPLLTSLNKIVHRRDLIAPHLRMIALTDCLVLYGNDGFQYLSPTARSTVLTTLVSLLNGRVDDYLVTRLLTLRWPKGKPQKVFETLHTDVVSVKPGGPTEGLPAVKQILLVLGSIASTNKPSLLEDLHNVAVKLNSRSPEQSKYPRSIQYIITSLLKKKSPVSLKDIPRSGLTPLSYVHWPTYELPPKLVDNTAKEVEDGGDYKITHLTKELSLDLVSPALDPTVRGNLLVVAMRLLTTDQMTVTLAQQLLRAIHGAVTLVPSLWPRNSLILLQDIPTVITRPIIRSLPPVQTAILPALLHHMINRASHIPKAIIDTLIKFAPSQSSAVEIVRDVIGAILKYREVPVQVNLSTKLVKVLDERAGSSALPIKEVADLLTQFRDRLSPLAKRTPDLRPVIKYIDEVLRRLQSEPLSALRNLKKYLKTLPGPAPVELVRSIFEDFPSWTPNDLQTVVGLVRAALPTAKSRGPEIVGSVAVVAMRLLRLYNYTDGTEKALVDVIDQVPESVIPQQLKLILVNDILFVLATKVTQKSESHVTVPTLLRLLDTVLRSGDLPTSTASVESHFIKAVAAFVDNKFALRKVTRELRVRLADLLGRLDLQHFIPLEILVKIDKQLRKEMWTVIRKVHTTTEERSITQFLEYLKTAHRDEIVRMDEGSMRNLAKVMLPLPPRALRNVVSGVEDVLRLNHEIIHRDLARQLLTIVQTAISSPMFPAKLLPRSRTVMDALKQDIWRERGSPAAM